MEPKFTIKETDQTGSRMKVQIVTESFMSGTYPNIPLPADINIESIPESERVFVTLPIGQFNAQSLNGRSYSETSMRQLMDQVNQRRPESNWGHIKDEDSGHTYNEPPVRWLAAVSDQNGVVWGKARALTPESQRYYRNAKIDNAKVGTSIVAWAEMDENNVVQNLDLLSVDLADPARVGVPITSAKPLLSSEMDNKDKPKEDSLQEVIAKERRDMEKAQESLLRGMFNISEDKDILTEMNVVRTNLQKSAEMQSELTDLKGKAEAQTQEIDGLKKTSKEQLDANTALVAENAKLLSETMKAFVESKVKLPKTREIVFHLLKVETYKNVDEMKTAVEKVLEMEFVKEQLTGELVNEMGGVQRRPAGSASDQDKAAALNQFFDIPEGVKI